MNRTDRSSRGERGQVLVIVAVGMLIFIAMVALVIDGGFAWGRQRATQNGTDASAEAGAVLLAQNLPFRAAGEAPPHSDADVLAAVENMAATNDIEVEEAQYTDFDGNEIGVEVGSLGGGTPPAEADGVKVTAFQQFDTVLAGAIGFGEMTARTDATAHAGYVIELPGSAVLPVTVPVTVPLCDNTGFLEETDLPWTTNTEIVLFLCRNGPGNVGWLDWTPPAGGASELADAIENPNNDPMEIPGWYFVSQTGNVNSGQVQDALETWIGRGPVFIPLFDATCDTEPADLVDGECTGGAGNGQNQWYHFRNWIAYDITSVHVTGGNSECGANLNGQVGCVRGIFRQMLGPGTLGEAVGDESVLAVVGVGLID